MSKPSSAVDYLAKAERALSGARVLLGVGGTEGACSRAYYAMFDGAHAALIMYGEVNKLTTIKTHSGLLTVFSKELVKAGRVSLDLSKSLDQVQQLRLAADYLGDPPSSIDAVWAVERAESFLKALGMMIPRV